MSDIIFGTYSRLTAKGTRLAGGPHTRAWLMGRLGDDNLGCGYRKQVGIRVRSARHPHKVNIEPQMGALVHYLESRDDVLAAYLYGSYGTAHQTALSDVDIAVLFYRDKLPDRRRLLTLEADISSICREDDVNVLPLNEADVMLQFRVLETGRPLLEKEPGAVSDFREYVFRVHGDFEPFYRAFCRDYDHALREAYSRDRPRQGQG